MSFFQKCAINGVRVYQYLRGVLALILKSAFGYVSECKHTPTCSEYTIESIQKYGTMRGLFRGLLRIMQCW